MNSNIENKPSVLAEGIIFLDKFIPALEDIVDNKMGPLWHDKNRQLVKDGAAELRHLDKQWRRFNHGIEQHNYRQIQQKMARVRQLISQYILLLEGSRSLVLGEIGRINKAKLIRGYRFRNTARVSSGQLC